MKVFVNHFGSPKTLNVLGDLQVRGKLIVGKERRGSRAPHCPPHVCGRGRGRNIFFRIHGMMVLRESCMMVSRESQRQVKE
jgi:hypothetical protein